MNHICIKNCEPVAVAKIPTLGYDAFREEMLTLMAEESNHIAAYFAMPTEDGRLRIVGCIAEDSTSDIAVSSATVEAGAVLPALSAEITAFERFEREIAENSGITFEGHPWPKPLRTAPDNYPFFDIKGEELHQVGVGPIHAGVIEPGHFRFICNGEKILHLEIMLGYQHRGVEKQFIGKTRLNQRALLAESIAGDTAVSHSVAFADAWEALCGVKVSERCRLERMLASELERIAIHTGDLSAICGDVAYQLGSAVYGRLRTPIINFMQCWCGNRLGKGCVRPFSQPYPFTSELAAQLETVLARYRRDFEELSNHLKRFPPVLSRLERTGVVTRGQAVEIGAVGMAAKASGLCRDIRYSHPYLDYAGLNHTPVVKRHGDVYSRTQVR
ncbi:MAG: NADH-quinone oxidoreductase subunit C, partial [Bacteroidales bacterium]|nr:NADH-quinone oxidoreductase subunit C [Bacteroidales bacterium]